MTTGESHGPPWVPPELQDIGNVKLDSIPHDLPAGVRDPDRWEQDPVSGVYYRGLTEDEISTNGWDPGTLLVILPGGLLDDFRVGATTVLDLPIAEPPGHPQIDLPFVSVDIEQRAQHDRLPFVWLSWDRGGNPTPSTTRSLIRFYLPVGLDYPLVDDVVVQVFASQSGFGVALAGAMEDRLFDLAGPYFPGAPHWLEVPLPVGNRFYILKTKRQTVPSFFVSSGTGVRGLVGGVGQENAQVPFDLTLEAAPAPSLAGTCADWLDNDKDLFGDGCDFDCVPHNDFGGEKHDHIRAYEYTKNFGIFGDATFCAENPGMAAVMLFTMWGMSAAEILNQTEAPDPYAGDVRTPPFRLLGGACVTNMTPSQARACHLDAQACPPGYESYAFAGVGANWGVSCGDIPGGYMARVWDLVENWAEATAASDLHPLHTAVAVLDAYHGGTFDDGVRGLAYVDLFPKTSRIAHRGAALVLGETASGTGIAHEIGHTMGLAHDTTWVGGMPGFMRDGIGGIGAPVLQWDAPSLVPSQPDQDACEILSTGGTPPGSGPPLKQGEVWASEMLNKWHPRPSGFKFVGCGLHGCSQDHPLQCVGGSVNMCLPAGQ